MAASNAQFPLAEFIFPGERLIPCRLALAIPLSNIKLCSCFIRLFTAELEDSINVGDFGGGFSENFFLLLLGIAQISL
jgi:hypothetical protein